MRASSHPPKGRTTGGSSGWPSRLRPRYGSGAGSMPSSASSVGAKSVCPSPDSRTRSVHQIGVNGPGSRTRKGR